ncbi:IS110 family transposase, partial [Escherichia coli]|uniref:IS110 family transposase n=1 Tax=Escherichia coli TaxID=562 RepID=UPI0021CA4A82
MHSENIAAYIGLDVHKETLAVAIAAPERLGEVRYYGTINNEAQAVRRLFQKLQGLYGNILSCYEAGPCGFGLYHQLTAMNIKCQVIAPSRIPKSPTDRIKNDHRDAISLARLLNRPGCPGECFICELRLPDHRFRWKHNKLFL